MNDVSSSSVRPELTGERERERKRKKWGRS
jgi:hypothetical protein